MNKKQFAALRKVLKKAETVYVQCDCGTIRVADGHFIVWMPLDDYAEHLGDILPDVTVASRWARRKGEWKDCGPDLSQILSDHRLDDDSRLAKLSPWSFTFDEYLRLVILSETSVVLVDVDLFRACDDLVDGAFFASERNRGVWFYGDSYGSGDVGAFLLPVNYSGSLVDSLKELTGRFAGAFSE